jgi:hypothetical protein
MKPLLSIILLLFCASIGTAGQGMGPGPGVKAYSGGSYTFPQNGVISNFTGTDGTTPSGWTDYYNHLAIASNMLGGNASGDSNSGGLTATYSNNSNEFYFSVITKPATGEYLELYDVNNVTGDGYVMRLDIVTGASNDTNRFYSYPRGK